MPLWHDRVAPSVAGPVKQSVSVWELSRWHFQPSEMIDAVSPAPRSYVVILSCPKFVYLSTFPPTPAFFILTTLGSEQLS